MPPRPSLLEIFLTALRLGCTSFGGPVAHLAYFREEYVVKRRWLAQGPEGRGGGDRRPSGVGHEPDALSRLAAPPAGGRGNRLGALAAGRVESDCRHRPRRGDWLDPARAA